MPSFEDTCMMQGYAVRGIDANHNHVFDIGDDVQSCFPGDPPIDLFFVTSPVDHYLRLLTCGEGSPRDRLEELKQSLTIPVSPDLDELAASQEIPFHLQCKLWSLLDTLEVLWEGVRRLFDGPTGPSFPRV